MLGNSVGKNILCVLGLIATIILYVSIYSLTDAPVVDCDPSWAQVGERNVFLRCKVKAKPKVAALFWIIDTNGTTVTEGQVVNEHWTLVMVCIYKQGHMKTNAPCTPTNWSPCPE